VISRYSEASDVPAITMHSSAVPPTICCT
jgi:hypothetical protein